MPTILKQQAQKSGQHLALRRLMHHAEQQSSTPTKLVGWDHSDIHCCFLFCVFLSQHNKDLGFVMNPGDGAIPCLQLFTPKGQGPSASHVSTLLM